MKKMLCLLILAMLPVMGSSLAGEDGWNQEFEKEGIKVFTRNTAGFPVKEFLGVAVIDTAPAVVNKVLNDANSFKEWMFECSDSALLEQNGPNDLTMWTVTKAPFPVSDRDGVIKTIVEVSKDKITRKFYAVTHPSKPVSKKYVRMPRLEGAWTLTAVPGGTEVRYQLKSDPGGSLPDWVANMKVKETPFGSLKGLRKQVKKPQYNN